MSRIVSVVHSIVLMGLLVYIALNIHNMHNMNIVHLMGLLVYIALNLHNMYTMNIVQSIYIYALHVCLYVRLYPINVLFLSELTWFQGRFNYKILFLNFFDFCKILKMRKNIIKSANFYYFFLIVKRKEMLTKRATIQIWKSLESKLCQVHKFKYVKYD